MFVVEAIEDVIKVSPSLFRADGVKVVSELIEEKFCNTVINGSGLVVSLYDIESIGEGKVHAETLDGAVFVQVKFRLVVFKPFEGEILIGTVKYCLQNYVKVNLGFFDDVVIYADLLPQPIKFIENHKDSMFKWLYNEKEDTKIEDIEEIDEDESEAFFIGAGQLIRFHVVEVKFDHDIVLCKRDNDLHQQFKAQVGSIDLKMKKESEVKTEVKSDDVNEVITKLRKSMVVLGKINEAGLGPLDWWNQEDSEAENEEE